MKVLTLTTLGAALLLSSAGAFASHPNKGFEKASHHTSRADRVVIQHHYAPAPADRHFRNHEWAAKHSYRHLQRDRLLGLKARPRHPHRHNTWYNKRHDYRHIHRHSGRHFDRHHEQPLKLQNKNAQQQWKRGADPRLQASSDRAHGERRTPHQRH